MSNYNYYITSYEAAKKAREVFIMENTIGNWATLYTAIAKFQEVLNYFLVVGKNGLEQFMKEGGNPWLMKGHYYNLKRDISGLKLWFKNEEFSKIEEWAKEIKGEIKNEDEMIKKAIEELQKQLK